MVQARCKKCGTPINIELIAPRIQTGISLNFPDVDKKPELLTGSLNNMPNLKMPKYRPKRIA